MYFSDISQKTKQILAFSHFCFSFYKSLAAMFTTRKTSQSNMSNDRWKCHMAGLMWKQHASYHNCFYFRTGNEFCWKYELSWYYALFLLFIMIHGKLNEKILDHFTWLLHKPKSEGWATCTMTQKTNWHGLKPDICSNFYRAW